MTQNPQRDMDHRLAAYRANGQWPSLLLHSCCGPCSSYVLEYLAGYFDITVLSYNPNIDTPEEYQKRLQEQRRVIDILSARLDRPIVLQESAYDPERFYALCKGLENEPEGGRRCEQCFLLRLEESARQAAAYGADLFTTTLSVSPHKNAERINRLGLQAGTRHGVDFLPADFKKKGGYQRSVALSKEWGLYRQRYCGCVFSKPTEPHRAADESLDINEKHTDGQNFKSE